jgi:hypothetical protein
MKKFLTLFFPIVITKLVEAITRYCFIGFRCHLLSQTQRIILSLWSDFEVLKMTRYRVVTLAVLLFFKTLFFRIGAL